MKIKQTLVLEDERPAAVVYLHIDILLKSYINLLFCVESPQALQHSAFLM